MTKEQILSLIEKLAHSQGTYGRLLEAIREDETILDNLKVQRFGSDLDFIMYFEGGF